MACCFFFKDPATTEIYPLSLHDALPIFTPEQAQPAPSEEKQVIPQSVRRYQLATPFLAPDFEAYARPKQPTSNRLANWELIEPLFRSFEYGSGGNAASMELPEAGRR